MKQYIVKYNSTRGDLCSVWINAESREDAKRKVNSEYWDIKDIVMIQEM